MANPDLEFGALQKPAPGSGWLESKQRAADRKAAERKVMEDAKRRDGHTCRFPRCEFMPKKPRIEAAHETHRGMGGDKGGTRTTRDQLLTLCFAHHRMWDTGEIDVKPVTPRDGFDGPAAFYRRSESGRMEHVATESRIGVSVTR